MTYENIRLEYRDRVAVLTLNAPEVLNALSNAMVSELHDAIVQVINSEARCLLMTGEGRAFSAGANLQQRGRDNGPAAPGSALETHYHPVMTKLRKMEIPMVTAINGPAVGVGMSFAVMADYALAAKSAYFLQAFANIGLVPDGGSTWLLARTIGRARAMEMALLGEKVSAEQAMSWGLVNRVVEDADLRPTALDFAQKLATGPTVALALTRKLIWEASESDMGSALHGERVAQRTAGRTSDFREGVSAFLQKRPAEFKGK